MDINKVIRLCVDGIYFEKGYQFPIIGAFIGKRDKMTFGNSPATSYISNIDWMNEGMVDGDRIRDYLNFVPIIDGGRPRDHYAKELHLGPGGCGKTHMNCTDDGLVKPVFLPPSWKLSQAKRNEYGIDSSVWARALTDDPERISKIKTFHNTIIIDEVSMLTENQKRQFFELYGDMKIIMCGDLGYQLPPVSGEEMKKEGFEFIQTHTENFRCKCPILKHMLNKLREMIDEKRSTQYINNWAIAEFVKLGRKIFVDQLKEMYTKEDMILTGTNELKNFYTDLFPHMEKYYVTECNKQYSNGDIIIGPKPENTKAELRHAFTTHSIQGESAKQKLFIDCRRMFDSRMFYTAVSRASYMDQIYIVDSREISMPLKNYRIYKIVSSSGVYIGSTDKDINIRFNQHKSDFKNYIKNGGKYITVFKLLNDPDVRIELLEELSATDDKEKWKREAYYINMMPCVNKTFKGDR